MPKIIAQQKRLSHNLSPDERLLWRMLLEHAQTDCNFFVNDNEHCIAVEAIFQVHSCNNTADLKELLQRLMINCHWCNEQSKGNFAVFDSIRISDNKCYYRYTKAFKDNIDDQVFAKDGLSFSSLNNLF